MRRFEDRVDGATQASGCTSFASLAWSVCSVCGESPSTKHACDAVVFVPEAAAFAPVHAGCLR